MKATIDISGADLSFLDCELDEIWDAALLKKFTAALDRCPGVTTDMIRDLYAAIALEAVKKVFANCVYLSFRDDCLQVGTISSSVDDGVADVKYDNVFVNLTEKGRDDLVRRLSAFTFYPDEEPDEIGRDLSPSQDSRDSDQ